MVTTTTTEVITTMLKWLNLQICEDTLHWGPLNEKHGKNDMYLSNVTSRSIIPYHDVTRERVS